MTQEEKYAAQKLQPSASSKLLASLFADGKVTAAPEGAKLSYEVIVPGGGTGDHPAFAILTGARDSLANLGVELKINDPADATSFGMPSIPANRNSGLQLGAQPLTPICTRSITAPTLLVWKALLSLTTITSRTRNSTASSWKLA
jgi:hypothetical protein